MRGLAVEAPEAKAIAWTDAQRQVFERHVVNLRQGELSGDGSFQSSKAQVEKIFSEHLPAALAAAKARGDRLRIMFYAHGGLTDEAGGLRMPLARNAFWIGNGVYPIYFVWETGFRETLADLLGGIVGRRPGLEGVSDIADAAIERGARLGGRPIWGSMKESAAKAVRSTGGAALVARLTADLWRAESRHLELHAIGHSAGAIFHAHFLPLLTSQKVPAGTPPISVQSLHFLAPAATNALFKKRLMPIIGRNKPVSALTMYTMRDDVERKDPSVPAYGKSLLYLVRAAFEDETNTELVGMEISLRSDLDLIRFFGIGGRQAVADIVFSTTALDAPLTSRSSSVEHGDFDNDADTMNSVMRRILGVSDVTKIVDYHEEPVDMGLAEEMAFEAVAAPVRGTRSRTAAARTRRASRGAASKKKWTLMVWMAGDNNLESFGTKDLLEMKRVGSTDDVDVLVQFDRQSDDRTRRYHVKAGGAIDDDVVEELGETNSGDPAVAVDFFRWGMQRCPSERVLTVLWNHGSGVDDTDIYARATRGGGAARGPAQPVRAAVRTVAASRHRRALFSTTIDAALSDRAIAFDDTSRDFLDTLELKRVLLEASREAGRAIDLVGFDACLMNMVEIAHQLRGTTDFIVGSEDIEPGDGWPYDRVLEALNANPSMDAQGLRDRRRRRLRRRVLDRAHHAEPALRGARRRGVDGGGRAGQGAARGNQDAGGVRRAQPRRQRRAAVPDGGLRGPVGLLRPGARAHGRRGREERREGRATGSGRAGRRRDTRTAQGARRRASRWRGDIPARGRGGNALHQARFREADGLAQAPRRAAGVMTARPSAFGLSAFGEFRRLEINICAISRT